MWKKNHKCPVNIVVVLTTNQAIGPRHNMVQQDHPSHFPRRNDGKRVRGPNSPHSSGGLYPHRSGGGCSGIHDAPGDGDVGLPDNPYGSGSDSSSSSEFER